MNKMQPVPAYFRTRQTQIFSLLRWEMTQPTFEKNLPNHGCDQY